LKTSHSGVGCGGNAAEVLAVAGGGFGGGAAAAGACWLGTETAYASFMKLRLSASWSFDWYQGAMVPVSMYTA
jgi:hypothetical protein